MASVMAVQYPSKSIHCADAALQPFLAPSFDPADFLNAALPPLGSPSGFAAQEVSLAELSTQTQTLLSQLSAHTTRLTSTLTSLTDEILRSGSRLAYEVEVLRGEALGLSETLTEGLQEDVSNFVPGGLEIRNARRLSRAADGTRRRSSTVPAIKHPVVEAASAPEDPEYITQLRILTEVRSKLDTVIKTFGDAMSWTLPPSEVSVTSSFISVSAPEPGSEAHSVEEKGQQVSKKLRDEVADLLLGQDPADAIETAARRVEELKELAQVWKGSAEEKARIRFVEGLAKMVEDRHRELLREQEQAPNKVENLQAEAHRVDDSAQLKNQASYGFMSQFQKIRGGL